MIYPNGHVDYLMYKNGGPLIGIAKVTMPTVKYKTVTASGAGLIELDPPGGHDRGHDVQHPVFQRHRCCG